MTDTDNEASSAPGSAIVTAIAAVMGEVGTVAKRGHNRFHQYDYATAADILHSLQPVMARHGLVVMQNEAETNFTMDGRMLNVTYEFTMAHASGQVWPDKIRTTGAAAAVTSKGGPDDKAFNKCRTAALKFFLVGQFLTPTGDFPEADADGDVPEAPSQKAASTTYEWVRGNGETLTFEYTGQGTKDLLTVAETAMTADTPALAIKSNTSLIAKIGKSAREKQNAAVADKCDAILAAAAKAPTDTQAREAA